MGTKPTTAEAPAEMTIDPTVWAEWPDDQRQAAWAVVDQSRAERLEPPYPPLGRQAWDERVAANTGATPIPYRPITDQPGETWGDRARAEIVAHAPYTVLEARAAAADEHVVVCRAFLAEERGNAVKRETHRRATTCVCGDRKAWCGVAPRQRDFCERCWFVALAVLAERYGLDPVAEGKTRTEAVTAALDATNPAVVP